MKRMFRYLRTASLSDYPSVLFSLAMLMGFAALAAGHFLITIMGLR